MQLLKVVSGGQTGVDRAALDAAIACAIAVGGWCPRGRRSEAGPIPAQYPLVETPSHDYPVRTEWNVRDSDATLVVTLGEPDGGTNLTIKLAAKLGKPCAIVRPDRKQDLDSAVRFIGESPGSILNVAGPRESSRQGIYRLAFEFLVEVFRRRDEGEGELAVAIPKRPLGKDGAEA